MKKTALTPDSAYLSVSALCAGSEQCSADVLAKLLRRGLSRCDAEAVVDRLVDEGFICDERFAGAFARDKAYFAGWGKFKIRSSLVSKRIPRDIIDDALDSIDSDRYFDVVKSALRSKARSVAGREPEKARAAIYRFAASRGFEMSLVSRIIPDFSFGDDFSEDYEY